MAAPLHIVAVQGRDVPSGQPGKDGEAVGHGHDLDGNSGVQFVDHGQAAKTVGRTKVGSKGDLGDITLANGLEEGSPRRMISIDSSDAEADELGIGIIEAVSVVVDGGKQAKRRFEKCVAYKRAH